MTIMADWKIADAKERFSELLRESEAEPQLIFNRERFVAAVVDADTYSAFEKWRESQRAPSLADRFAELRGIAAQQHYILRVPRRRSRPTPTDDELSD